MNVIEIESIVLGGRQLEISTNTYIDSQAMHTSVWYTVISLTTNSQMYPSSSKKCDNCDYRILPLYLILDINSQI